MFNQNMKYKNVEYSIDKLPTYPPDGKHQFVNWMLPYKIDKGRDTYYYRDKDNNERHSDSKHWYCHIDYTSADIDLHFFARFDIKGFLKVNDAIGYCLNHYINWLEKRLKELKYE
jgi:hypothetical protein